ncbi:MAG: hypothetical protein SH850_02315, partial [Planctomycetaceae bacterium]|nr:hypothetical protein [Planctomycetaceae bacterium]
MPTNFPPSLCDALTQSGQGPLLDQVRTWPHSEQLAFLADAEQIDWPVVQRLYRSATDANAVA